MYSEENNRVLQSIIAEAEKRLPEDKRVIFSSAKMDGESFVYFAWREKVNDSRK